MNARAHVASTVTALLLAASAAACSASNGDDVSVREAEAEVRSQTFPCGGDRCTPDAEYCAVSHVTAKSLGDATVAYACVALPARCVRDPHCDCVQGADATCTESGGLVILERP